MRIARSTLARRARESAMCARGGGGRGGLWLRVRRTRTTTRAPIARAATLSLVCFPPAAHRTGAWLAVQGAGRDVLLHARRQEPRHRRLLPGRGRRAHRAQDRDPPAPAEIARAAVARAQPQGLVAARRSSSSSSSPPLVAHRSSSSTSSSLPSSWRRVCVAAVGTDRGRGSPSVDVEPNPAARVESSSAAAFSRLSASVSSTHAPLFPSHIRPRHLVVPSASLARDGPCVLRARRFSPFALRSCSTRSRTSPSATTLRASTRCDQV